MIKGMAQSVIDTAFGPETKVQSEEHLSTSQNEYMEDTTSNIWYRIELLVKDLIPGDIVLTNYSKSRILCITNMSRLEELSQRMGKRGAEFSSGRGLRSDLQGYHKTVSDLYERELELARIAEEKKLAAEEKKFAREFCFGLFYVCLN